MSTHPNRSAWIVVIVGFIALAVAFSTRATLSLVMPVWQAELGWSASFVSGVAACALIVMALTAPVAGIMIDRLGARTSLSAGLVLVAMGAGLVATTSNSIVFAIGFAGVAAVGFGIVALHTVSTAVALAFKRNRGLATGIATSGSGPWACFRSIGPFSFQATGIVQSLVNPLSNAGIGVFVICTFDGEHLLVSADEAHKAESLLTEAGHLFVDQR